MTIRTTSRLPVHKHGAHLVDEDDLEGLGLLWLPDCDLSLGEERVAQAHGEDVESILTGLGGGVRSGVWCSTHGHRGLRARVKTSDKHDGCELHKQLRRVGVHADMGSSSTQ